MPRDIESIITIFIKIEFVIQQTTLQLQIIDETEAVLTL